MPALVVTDRLHAHATAPCQYANAISSLTSFPVDSVPWYGLGSDAEKGCQEMRSPLNAKTALVGGMLASIGASACCVGPLLLLSLGIGGAILPPWSHTGLSSPRSSWCFSGLPSDNFTS